MLFSKLIWLLYQGVTLQEHQDQLLHAAHGEVAQKLQCIAPVDLNLSGKVFYLQIQTAFYIFFFSSSISVHVSSIVLYHLGVQLYLPPLILVHKLVQRSEADKKMIM